VDFFKYLVCRAESADGGRPQRKGLRVPSPSPSPSASVSATPAATKNGKGSLNHERDGDDLFLELGLHPEPSPANSITSLNSISSLLKEKLAVSGLQHAGNFQR